jgi:hypothetical protein
MNAVLDKDTDTLQKYLVEGCESLIFDLIKFFLKYQAIRVFRPINPIR